MAICRSIVYFIFSLLILFVAAYPCADKYIDSSDLDFITYIVDHSSISQEDMDNDFMDHCSPLCSCTCCAASITIAYTLSIPYFKEIEHIEKLQSEYESLYKSIVYSIWQPPKIV